MLLWRFAALLVKELSHLRLLDGSSAEHAIRPHAQEGTSGLKVILYEHLSTALATMTDRLDLMIFLVSSESHCDTGKLAGALNFRMFDYSTQAQAFRVS
jgi:hypothetical protein